MARSAAIRGRGLGELAESLHRVVELGQALDVELDAGAAARLEERMAHAFEHFVRLGALARGEQILRLGQR